MTPDKLITALIKHRAIIVFPTQKDLIKAVKDIGFYEKKPKFVTAQFYGYKGIPFRMLEDILEIVKLKESKKIVRII